MLDSEAIDLIEKLAELRAAGALTEAEFNSEKQRIFQAAMLPLVQNGAHGAQNAPPISTVALAAGFITTHLGLARIERFSISHLFSETFKHHPPEEVENLFSVGTSLTTPLLSAGMENFPTPWVFFRALIASLALFAGFMVMFYGFSNPKVIPGLIFIGSFAVPLATLIFFFEINTPRNVSMYRLLSFVIAGGTVSLLLTLVLNVITDLPSVLGAPSAGIIEEIAKIATVVLLLTRFSPDRYRYRLNALLFGAAVGAGFAAFESAGYALEYGLAYGSADTMVGIIFMRALLTPLCHIAWTAITSAAYWDARRKHASAIEAITSPTFLKLFAVPVVLHFIWNSLGDTIWVLAALGFVAWVIIISLVQSGLGDIAAELRAKP
ncbi:MAG TPA: PrsW family glutamic-type intramembrane protease [Sphingorhabdus sp.]|jgi:RsiW-degrading membrane proteinase PrsW (M82 family)|nr:PrsW family glutamic-type intramembrane protease [Sphingorhabdus sp.]